MPRILARALRTHKGFLSNHSNFPCYTFPSDKRESHTFWKLLLILDRRCRGRYGRDEWCVGFLRARRLCRALSLCPVVTVASAGGSGRPCTTRIRGSARRCSWARRGGLSPPGRQPRSRLRTLPSLSETGPAASRGGRHRGAGSMAGGVPRVGNTLDLTVHRGRCSFLQQVAMRLGPKSSLAELPAELSAFCCPSPPAKRCDSRGEKRA